MKNSDNDKKYRKRHRRETQNKYDKLLKEYLSSFDIEPLLENAQNLERHFVIHCGPTNSGKTYEALQALRKAYTGVYLGPLRLLALEVSDELNNDGIPCDLLTGEEYLPAENARITASTIEMCDYTKRYDVAVIDEAQLITDPSRGKNWTNAVYMVNAAEVHICVAPEAMNLIISIVEGCNSTYELRMHERLVPLVWAGHMQNFKSAENGDALVAFSRKNVLAIASALEEEGIRASVIYGALPPQSRREEVRRFVQGETTVVVATDAIGMGISLPIKRVIFCQTQKYDGISFRSLEPAEIKQIAGRAGRYGKYEIGEVLSMENDDLISRALDQQIKQAKLITLPFPKKSLDGRYKITELLRAWSKLPKIPGYRREDVSEAQVLLSRMNKKFMTNKVPQKDIFSYITCPVDVKSERLLMYWVQLCSAIVEKHENYPSPVIKTESLEQCEYLYKALDIEHQMMRRIGINKDNTKQKEIVAEKINQLLKAGKENMQKKCVYCGKTLEPASRYNICDKCHSILF